MRPHKPTLHPAPPHTPRSNPPAALAGGKWAEVSRDIRRVLERFKQEKVTVGEAAPGGGSAACPRGAPAAADGDGVAGADDASSGGAGGGGGQGASVKYLSSSRLMGLQLRDATLRRHFLLQCLILMQVSGRSGLLGCCAAGQHSLHSCAGLRCCSAARLAGSLPTSHPCQHPNPPRPAPVPPTSACAVVRAAAAEGQDRPAVPDARRPAGGCEAARGPLARALTCAQAAMPCAAARPWPASSPAHPPTWLALCYPFPRAPLPQDLRSQVYSALAETAERGREFAAAIRHLLQWEDAWAAWKQGGCPAAPLERPPAQAPAAAASVDLSALPGLGPGACMAAGHRLLHPRRPPQSQTDAVRSPQAAAASERRAPASHPPRSSAPPTPTRLLPAAAPAPKRRKLGSDAIFGVRVGTEELDRLWNLTEDNLSGEIVAAQGVAGMVRRGCGGAPACPRARAAARACRALPPPASGPPDACRAACRPSLSLSAPPPVDPSNLSALQRCPPTTAAASSRCDS